MSDYKLGSKEEFDKIAKLIGYPEEWDDVAYDTLASAIYELLSWLLAEVEKG